MPTRTSSIIGLSVNSTSRGLIGLATRVPLLAIDINRLNQNDAVGGQAHHGGGGIAKECQTHPLYVPARANFGSGTSPYPDPRKPVAVYVDTGMGEGPAVCDP